MEKNRSTKIIGIVALIIAVIGMSIGFAAFSRTLDIKPEAAVSTKKEGDLEVVFDYFEGSAITATASEGASADITNASLDNDHLNSDNVANPLISGLKANFTDKGQTVTFKFKVKNMSPYEAFRTGVTFAGTNECSCISEVANSSCTTSEESIVNDACGDISMSIKFRNDDSDSYVATTNNTNIQGKSLKAAGSNDSEEVVEVSVTYNGTHTVPINDFTVTLPTISLIYSSLDN